MLFKKRFFNRQEEEQIVRAIRTAERTTSGEIRVHIHTDKLDLGILDEAANTFTRLGMDKTAEHNGVLIYFAPKEKVFAIIGDKGINEQVPAHFWDEVKDTMQTHFKQQLFAEGIEKGILLAGEQLQTHFPWQEDDENELPDEISYT